ncbi:AAA family ATPase [Stenotrophomonas rhizophila]|uniref:ATP-dependent endonuclease of OLD family n=1 Tax=Stenotrophomonas rhizophila TaxID=216778 RepID=A0AAW5PLX7_9GAMM|nr:AAA family ATPase [Stenotrophomonas rhizophila]MCS4281584.1 putative ATP-dependent endonuclease of OLD family [Stenotrophomonas rhizophila]
MIITQADVGPFRSIQSVQAVNIDTDITVLVGMNEAGKTVFLKALEKAMDALGVEKFNITDDYPRKDVNSYRKRHDSSPDTAVTLHYAPSDEEIDDANTKLGTALKYGFSFSVSHTYANKMLVKINVEEGQSVKRLAETDGISGEAKAAITSSKSVRGALAALKSLDLNEAEGVLLKALEKRVSATDWDRLVAQEVWLHFSPLRPKFLYFSDYDLLPGKLNLKDLRSRLSRAEADPESASTHLKPAHRAVIALLRMADVELEDFSGNTAYEELKAKVEAVSISLTDQILEFWKQNEDLEVEVDIRTDPTDEAPFNDGPNLYLRIKNRRHRGVTTPFDQRSRGFIWFFSFLVWFDSVRDQLDEAGGKKNAQLALLLDEPGLALHALAQADFLRYIDRLSEEHQVIYTTHSPFMVNSDRLHQVRVVEDRVGEGTVISDNLSGSDARTLFPLQASLGWTLAQNLFISKKNLLVEGPSELAYLQSISNILEAQGRDHLQSDVTIVPVGGLNNVATFVSLLGANGLQLCVLHDYDGATDQRLDNMVRQKLLNKKHVFSVAQFRKEDVKAGVDAKAVPSDLEDLLTPSTYIDYFKKVYSKDLNAKTLVDSDLPSGDRVVKRIEAWLSKQGITLRPSGGFNHYAVAAAFASSPPKKLDAKTLSRFEALFRAINRALTD